MKRATIIMMIALLSGMGFFLASFPRLFAQDLDTALSAAGNQTANGSISDFVWNDLDANGIQNVGEPGIANIGVGLYDCGHKPLDYTKTDADGLYSFDNLPQGCYILIFDRLTGYDFTTPGVGSAERDSNVNPATGESAQIQLAPGEKNNTIDAGYVCFLDPGSGLIGDQVWEDLNKDGIQGDLDGEPFVEGVEVQLLEGCFGNVVLDSQTTNADGWYTFFGPEPGQYRVRFILPSGFQFTEKIQGFPDFDSNANTDGTTDCIDLASGERNLTIDAGIVRTSPPLLGSIGNQVWRDLNSNGNQDDNEPYVEGVQVQLLRGCTGNSVLGTLTTDVNGFYNFTDLSAGQYRVRFTLPTGDQFTVKDQGLSDSSDSDANPDGTTDCIDLAPGENDPTVDAGLVATAPQLGSLGDRVWRDDNSNGIQDPGEPGIPGVTVQLKDCNNNILRTTTTDSNGNYSFTGLAAGCYRVGTVPNGFTISPANQGGNDSIDSDFDPNTAMTGNINLAAGENNPTVDAGLIPAPQVGSLGDRVWRDDNSNSIQDPGEPGVAGISVQLRNCAGTTLATTTTDSNGIYNFPNLNAGCYVVRFNNINSTQFSFSAPNQGGNDSSDSDVTLLDTVTPGIINGQTNPINLAAGENNPTVDAGLIPVPQNGSLGDRVWRDDNSNGIQDPGEPGVPNVTVQLKDCSNAVLRTTVTDSNGNYNFAGLAAGCYRVGVVPNGFTISPANRGNNDSNDSDVDPNTAMTGNINLAPGENNPTVDAGLVPPLACGLTLTKTCTAPPPPPSTSFTCKDAKPINELTLIWNGTQPVSISGEGNNVSNIQPGQRVTLNFATTQNDKIISLGGLGQSSFHLSCSDVDMDGPDDCGKAAGNGKKNDGGVNDWIFDGMAGSGQRLACSSTPPPPSDSCTVSLSSVPVCDGKNKPTSLTFRYTGGGCSATNNTQSGKATCSGSINSGLPINIVAGNKDFKKPYSVSPSTVLPGEEFTISASKFESDSALQLSNAGGSENLGIHTSCSKPLAVGDVFGSLTLVGADGQRADATVIFDYLVTNTADTLTNVSVTDDKLGDIGGPFSLAPGASRTFTKSTSISTSTTNTGFVEGALANGQFCAASDTVSVIVTNGRSQEVPGESGFRVMLPLISK